MVASLLRVGDRFVWCDRVVKVLHVAPANSGRRRGFRFTVREDDGAEHSLQYFADEYVRLA